MKIMDQFDPATINEYKLFSRVDHGNIVKYLGHFDKNIGGENKTFLFTEYCQVCRY